MREKGRPGCWQPLLRGVLGGISGALVAFLIGLIDAPVVNPADEMAHEWYTPWALFVLPFHGLIMGSIIGTFAGMAFEGAGGKALIRGLAGLILGLVVGMAIPATGDDTSRPECHLILTALFVTCAFFLAPQRAWERSRQADEMRE